ncbi:hypothetical protein ACLRDC_03825 [Gluconacetobacter sacchari]|uniref:DUF2125 domain-containing protein n=2 Tax=Gluconacetobacter sacchari TaxID=92759 RepID=A0A7W4IA71_9PROT|nr:hypothetical protein [Gluconacetobacter sacchari]MBB2159079.1 hypothetical protein [Gluconacetobacter sacchari]GBQ31672.1 hypothetical protein AA12717_3838 [Gluconacetobacter sacchari DSM 12717]
MITRIPVLPALLGTILAMATTGVQAAPLPPACAIAGAGSLSASATDMTALNYVLRSAPGTGAPSLHAASVTISGPAGDARALRDLLDAASVVLLGALVNHHGAGCTADYFLATLQPMMAGLESGRSYDIAWSSPVATTGARQIRFSAMHLHLSGGGDARPIAVSLEMRGAGINGDSVLAALLPQDARSDFAVPAQALGPLLAATAGRPARSIAVPVTIRTLRARRGDMQLEGSGTAELTGSPDAASAAGHMSMRNLPELIETLRAAGQIRPAGALALANLVGHHADTQTSWDVAWAGGILTVNHIPLPLR